MFYVNNYIDWDQFNQLYDPALTSATNQRLEVAREETRKKKEMVERRKTEAMDAKRRRARRRMSLSIEEEENYESDTRDETDPDQADNDENPLQL